MKKARFRSILICLALAATLGVQGCAATSAVGAVASGTFYIGKVAVKGAVGATKLVYKGGKSVVNTVGGGDTRHTKYHSSDKPYTGGNQTGNEPSCLHEDGSYTPAFKDASGIYSCQ